MMSSSSRSASNRSGSGEGEGGRTTTPCSSSDHAYYYNDDYEAARIALKERQIDAVFMERSRRFDDEENTSGGDDSEPSTRRSRRLVTLLSECFHYPLNNPPTDDDDTGAATTTGRLMEMIKPVIQVLDAVHRSGEDFSVQLFEAFIKSFEQGGWVVRRGPRRVVTSREDRRRIAADDDDEEEGWEYHFDDMIVVGRRRRDTCNDTKRSSNQEPAAEGDSSGEQHVDPRPESKYVCYVNNVMYAMGLSRKAKVGRGKDGVPMIINGESFPDLAWVIFTKPVGTAPLDADPTHDDESNRWSVYQLVAAVELTMEKSSTKIFKLRSGTKRSADGSRTTPCVGADPPSIWAYGPVLQQVAFALGHVLPGRASLGLDLPTSVPLVIVAGRRRSTDAASECDDTLRWVHGNVVTPDECGEMVYFVVDAFDSFRHDNGGSRAVLAALLDVLVNGMAAAETWLVKQTSYSSAVLLPPMPLSGRTVTFGGIPLEGLSLKYTPLSKRRLDRSEGAVKASQAEIFSGRLNLSSLKQSVPNDNHISWCTDTFDAAKSDPQVFVKVVSRACYGHLLGQEALLWNHGTNFRAFSSIRTCLAPSLHAVYTTPFNQGMVLIMPDLEVEGFVPVRPEMCSTLDARRALWGAFMRLVRDTLIPLAEEDIIHPDIRPGYNHTPNILWNPSPSAAPEATMRLIDLDSLVFLDRWSCPSDDKRYVSRRPLRSAPHLLRDAFDYLFCQVIVVTDSWIRKIRERDAEASDILAENDTMYEWSSQDPWPPCTASFILEALERIKESFLASGT